MTQSVRNPHSHYRNSETVQAARTLQPDNLAEPNDKPISKIEPPKANGHAKRKSSCAGSKRMVSTSTRMAATEEEQLATQELPQKAQKANKTGEVGQRMHPFAVVCLKTKSCAGDEISIGSWLKIFC